VGDLLPVRSVGSHHPDVFDTVAVARERDPPAVGTEPRLGLVRRSSGKERRVAARDRDRVEIPEKVEDDGLRVGADVDSHPCPFVRLERDLLRRSVGGRDVPRSLPVRGGIGGGGRLWAAPDRGNGRPRGEKSGEEEDRRGEESCRVWHRMSFLVGGFEKTFFKITSFRNGCNNRRTFLWKWDDIPYIDVTMTKDTTIRIVIILSLLVGYVIVAILRSGTAW
jgi:hypothetical protein